MSKTAEAQRRYRAGSAGSSAGSANQYQVQASRIANPTTKQDFLDRAEFIAQVSENGAYNYDVKTSDWQNYGKDRTYIKINQYDTRTGKLRQQLDWGYFDNDLGQYVKSRQRAFDLGKSDLFDIGGNNKFSEQDIVNELKKKNKEVNP